LTHFFHLTSVFFGLTSDYKIPLLDEIYICKQNLGFSYSDVLSMPTYERRYFLGLLTKQKTLNEEANDKLIDKGENKTSTGKGTRSSTLSGSALKSKINSGEIQ